MIAASVPQRDRIEVTGQPLPPLQVSGRISGRAAIGKWPGFVFHRAISQNQPRPTGRPSIRISRRVPPPESRLRCDPTSPASGARWPARWCRV